MEFKPWPYFTENEIQAVVNVLKSGKVNQWNGSEIQSFELEFAQYIGTNYAVALANGSLALDIALEALEIKAGDEVIVTPRSFMASVSCVALRGAIPVFVDIDSVSQNITFENIAKATTPKTKAVIAVNLAGWPCELDRIQSFCKEKNIFLVEDCAQAHGAEYKGRKAGSFGDCAIFSFCQDKIMTTGGEGGMLVTDNEKIFQRVWSFKDHGKEYSKVHSLDYPQGFRWLVSSLGTNARMTEMQAAIGRIMLPKLDKWVKKRREFAELFNEAFAGTPGIRLTIPDSDVSHSYYRYYVFVNEEELAKEWDRDRLLEQLNQRGIPCNTGICPEIYREEVFNSIPYRIASKNGEQFLPIAKMLGKTSLAFMVHPTLDIGCIEYTIQNVKSILAEAVR